MADQQGSNGTLSKTSTEKPIQHQLNTNIEPGSFDEKSSQKNDVKPVEDEEEDLDMDALIDELESNDGHAEDEETEDVTLGGARVVPEDQLATSRELGLTEQEVHIRRKKWGMNQMKEEKENMLIKFLWYFVGPIQFVMEVCILLIPLPCC